MVKTVHRLSSVAVLRTGLPCTRSVRAERQSERVPVERMVLRKWASDALCAEAYFAASAARSFAARSVREVSFAGEGAARSVLGGSGSTVVWDGGGALALVNAKKEKKYSPLSPAVS